MDDLKIQHVYYNFHIFLLVDKYFRKNQFETWFKIVTQDTTLVTEKTVGVAFGQRQDTFPRNCVITDSCAKKLLVSLGSRSHIGDTAINPGRIKVA